jgi:hypothetical protein
MAVDKKNTRKDEDEQNGVYIETNVVNVNFVPFDFSKVFQVDLRLFIILPACDKNRDTVAVA